VTPVNESLAPWFFLWVQQLLKMGDPFIYGVLIPLGTLLILVLVPYITPHWLTPKELGRWFPRGGRNMQILVGALGIIIILLTLLALLH
jgi:hypothetical protein